MQPSLHLAGQIRRIAEAFHKEPGEKLMSGIRSHDLEVEGQRVSEIAASERSGEVTRL